MKRTKQVSLIIFGVLVLAICATILVFFCTGRELTNEMMFACLAGLIVLFGSYILDKLSTLTPNQ